MNTKKSSAYSLNKSRKILRASYDCYKKKWKDLPHNELNVIEGDLQDLEQACQANDRQKADYLARKLEDFTQEKCKKSIFDYTTELVIALVIALAIATLVRSMWFEPYEIPTGSMRPTFKEQDHVLVSKTTFGINLPLTTDHIYFDPELVKRTGIFIFSGDGVNLNDTDTSYFGIFPAKKRYIKRCMGKPGDTLYFYGGKIYGIDKDGNDLSEIYDDPRLSKLDHVPFIYFEGRVSGSQGKPGSNNVSEITFRQMDLPIGRLTIKNSGEVEGEIFNGTDWIKDKPSSQETPHTTLQTYSDFWGFRNYAMARLLTREQVEKYSGVSTSGLKEGLLYLELRHNPSLTYPKPRFIRDEYDNFNLLLTPYVTIIPLDQQHLDAIMDNMYTARFVVDHGRAKRYSVENNHHLNGQSPYFPGVPDGTYEFYYGKADKLLWTGITSQLPDDHSLYKRDPQNIQRLFNLGIDMLTLYEPHAANQAHMPTRYAYFRDGDLYLLGAPVLKKDDETLIAFNKQEVEHEKKSTDKAPYIPFKDYGAPLVDGKIDKEFIKTFGFKIPEKHYLALGDNYAMSADSRYFGYVPESNIQGSPSLILWPPGSRWGCPNQKPYPWISLPNVIVWSIVILILAIWYCIHRRNLRKPVFKKLSS